MYLEGEVGHNKSGRTTINTESQFSFDISQNSREKQVRTAVPSLVRTCGGGLQVQVQVQQQLVFSIGLDYLLARVWTI